MIIFFIQNRFIMFAKGLTHLAHWVGGVFFIKNTQQKCVAGFLLGVDDVGALEATDK